MGVLILWIICGVVSASIASTKGRSQVGWFFGGLFLGLIGVVIVAVLPNLVEARRKEEFVDREHHRLREQLLQEQVKLEAFRAHTSARLDSHDEQLGLDTRTISPKLGMPNSPPLRYRQEYLQASQDEAKWESLCEAPPLPTDEHWNVSAPPLHDEKSVVPVDARTARRPPPLPKESTIRQWYFEESGQQRGPISDKQLIALAKSGQIIESTRLWTAQFSDWKSAGSIRALKQYLRVT